MKLLMDKNRGIKGYLILVLSAAFLDIPMIGLVAMITFLIGVSLLILFFVNFISEEKTNKWFFVSLVIIGVIMFSGALGYSAIEYTEYLVSMNRGEELLSSYRKLIIQPMAITIIASFIVLFGIGNTRKTDRRPLLIVWFLTLFLVPLVIVLIKLLELIGTPLSA